MNSVFYGIYDNMLLGGLVYMNPDKHTGTGKYEPVVLVKVDISNIDDVSGIDYEARLLLKRYWINNG